MPTRPLANGGKMTLCKASDHWPYGMQKRDLIIGGIVLILQAVWIYLIYAGSQSMRECEDNWKADNCPHNLTSQYGLGKCHAGSKCVSPMMVAGAICMIFSLSLLMYSWMLPTFLPCSRDSAVSSRSPLCSIRLDTFSRATSRWHKGSDADEIDDRKRYFALE
jgi:hypothetical protein